MHRVVLLALAVLFAPTVVAAQQPCTTDARQVVNELYRHMLERQPDPGSAHWVEQLESGRLSVKEVVRNIAHSPEYQKRFVYAETGEGTPYERSVARLYRHILGRQPDPAGQRAFAEVAQSQGADAVIDRILASREYNQQFGDWAVPGSGGTRFCANGNAANNQNQPVTNRRFGGMDRNNDGVISRQEWRGSPRSFTVHDWNGDGVLSGDEVNSAVARQGRTVEDEEFDRAEEFEYLDVNNNARIEPREWHGSVAAFNRLDANNDNRLTRVEFVNQGAGQGFGTAATSGQSILVDARERWTDTGLDVTAGDVITFDVDGQIRMSTNVDDVAGPAGSARRALQAPLRNQSAGALIGQINGRNFFIGNRRSMQVPVTGRLMLGVNDDHLPDNEGHFNVIVAVQ